MNAISQMKKVYVVDGITFDTKNEVADYLRRPQIMEALMSVTDNNAELSNWLLNNAETVEMAFDAGTIRRVSKAERKRLESDLAKLTEDTPFLQEHAAVILETFRWPTVKRMTPEEKLVAARNTISAYADGNQDLAEFVIAKKEEILAAYQAGVVKREVSAKATSGLAEYRARMAAEKAEMEAAEAQGPEAVEALKASRAAAKAAKEAEAAAA